MFGKRKRIFETPTSPFTWLILGAIGVSLVIIEVWIRADEICFSASLKLHNFRKKLLTLRNKENRLDILRSATINSFTVTEYERAGRFVTYINGRRQEESFEVVCERLKKDADINLERPQ